MQFETSPECYERESDSNQYVFTIWLHQGSRQEEPNEIKQTILYST